LKLTFEETSFLSLLKDLIGHAKKLQNLPPNLVPQEELAADCVVKYLAAYTEPKGPLKVRKLTYKPGRSNVIIEYPATAEEKTKKVISFVGAHMDVVPALAEEWSRDPFKLEQDGDTLYGRGVTDCLGHVACLSEVFRQLAIAKPKLRIGVWGVFIANEEASIEPGVGIDEMAKQGELAHLKSGPLFWVDGANFGPTLATAGVSSWNLTVTGKLFHSGFPNKAINPIELGMEAVKHMQERFYKDFPAHPKEKDYKFECGSSMKPTQINTPAGSLNQIPGSCTIGGDIRLTPFYDVMAARRKLEEYVKELDVNQLPTRGAAKHELKEEKLKGTLSLKWMGSPYQGVAVNLESPGYTALFKAIEGIRGSAKPFSLTGSLPIIRDLHDQGFDVQVVGFGRLDAYHAINEFGKLSEFKDGHAICAHIIGDLNKSL